MLRAALIASAPAAGPVRGPRQPRPSSAPKALVTRRRRLRGGRGAAPSAATHSPTLRLGRRTDCTLLADVESLALLAPCRCWTAAAVWSRPRAAESAQAAEQEIGAAIPRGGSSRVIRVAASDHRRSSALDICRSSDPYRRGTERSQIRAATISGPRKPAADGQRRCGARRQREAFSVELPVTEHLLHSDSLRRRSRRRLQNTSHRPD